MLNRERVPQGARKAPVVHRGRPGPLGKPAPQPQQGNTPIKLVVRCLPPLLTQDAFYEQTSDLANPETVLERYYVPGKVPSIKSKLPVYSRCYILFRREALARKFLLKYSKVPFSDETESLLPSIGRALYQSMPGTARRVPGKALLRDSAMFRAFGDFSATQEPSANFLDHFRQTDLRARRKAARSSVPGDKKKRTRPRKVKPRAQGEPTEPADRPKPPHKPATARKKHPKAPKAAAAGASSLAKPETQAHKPQKPRPKAKPRPGPKPASRPKQKPKHAPGPATGHTAKPAEPTPRTAQKLKILKRDEQN